MEKFIKTDNEHTASLLRDSGFKELAREGKYWVFINNDMMAFASEDAKVHRTNILTF